MWLTSSKITRCAIGFMSVVVLTGCATFGSQTDGRDNMFQTAVREGFKKQYLSVPPFVLTAYHKSTVPSDTLVVYIEGDGFAWSSRTRPSDNPTPKHPLAFFLACEDQSFNVLYLGTG